MEGLGKDACEPDNKINRNNYDMATVTKSLGEFHGKEEENPVEWIEAAEVIAELSNMTAMELMKTMIMCLRGEAKAWGISVIKGRAEKNWSSFKNEFLSRFTNHKKADETLSRFLNTSEVKTYEGFKQLIKDAKDIKSTKGINVDHLMRQVIARAPAGIKSLLLQAASSGAEWERFLWEAENGAWVVFPEKIVCRIQEEGEQQEINRIRGGWEKELGGKKSGAWYCHYHGQGDHSTKYCEVVRTLESKGWIRYQPSQTGKAREKSGGSGNKNSPNYVCKKRVLRISENPFFVKGDIKGKQIPVLFDTGADVSIINKQLLHKDYLSQIKDTNAKLRSASGEEIKVCGKVKDMEIKVEDHLIITDPVITVEEPKDYIIIGADAIVKNRSSAAEILGKAMIKKAQDKRKFLGIREIMVHDIINEFDELFRSEITEMNKCTVDKHEIVTSVSTPINQRNQQIPRHWEGEINEEVKKTLKGRHNSRV